MHWLRNALQDCRRAQVPDARSTADAVGPMDAIIPNDDALQP
jgi:hypothetical protein